MAVATAPTSPPPRPRPPPPPTTTSTTSPTTGPVVLSLSCPSQVTGIVVTFISTLICTAAIIGIPAGIAILILLRKLNKLQIKQQLNEEEALCAKFKCHIFLLATIYVAS